MELQVMSDEFIDETRSLAIVPWWWVAALVERGLKGSKFTRRMEPNGVTFICSGNEIQVIADAERTEVNCTGEVSFYLPILESVNTILRIAETYRRQNWAIEADTAIEHYYRARARGSKLTLKDIAEMTGYNYTYLSQVKSAYDKAGKWGSKPKHSPKSQT